jgi:hypothetical protein
MIWIMIDEGEIFSGTLEQFRDCFGEVPEEVDELDSIFAWCAHKAWKCQITNYLSAGERVSQWIISGFGV